MAFAYKAKRFNDWLYATLDNAAFLGDCPGMGRQAFVTCLQSVLNETLEGSLEETEDMLELKAITVPLSSWEVVRILAIYPQSCDCRSKNVSKLLRRTHWLLTLWAFIQNRRFYVVSLKHDRTLQEPVDGNIAGVLADAINRARLSSSYRWQLRVSELLNGAFAIPAVRVQGANGNDALFGQYAGQYALFPLSRAPETDLAKRLYGDRSISAGVCLIDEVIARVKDERLELQPSKSDGWYLREPFAFEALLHPGPSELRTALENLWTQ